MSTRADTIEEMAEEIERKYLGRAVFTDTDQTVVEVPSFGKRVRFAVEAFELIRTEIGTSTVYAWKLKQERRTDPPRILTAIREGNIDSPFAAVYEWAAKEFKL